MNSRWRLESFSVGSQGKRSPHHSPTVLKCRTHYININYLPGLIYERGYQINIDYKELINDLLTSER